MLHKIKDIKICVSFCAQYIYIYIYIYMCVCVWCGVCVCVCVCVCDIVIVIIALKGANFEIFTVSSLRRDLSPTRTLKWPRLYRVQITCNTSSACHVHQSHVVCHLEQRVSSVTRFDRV